MKEFAAIVMTVLVLLIVLAVVADSSNKSAANYEYAKGQARSMVIEAQGQAALNRAEANKLEIMARADAAVMTVASQSAAAVAGVMARAEATQMAMNAALPWGVITGVVSLGFAVVVLGLVIVTRRPTVIHAPPQITREIVVYLPRPGETRRDVWEGVRQIRVESVPVSRRFEGK